MIILLSRSSIEVHQVISHDYQNIIIVYTTVAYSVIIHNISGAIKLLHGYRCSIMPAVEKVPQCPLSILEKVPQCPLSALEKLKVPQCPLSALEKVPQCPLSILEKVPQCPLSVLEKVPQCPCISILEKVPHCPLSVYWRRFHNTNCQYWRR